MRFVLTAILAVSLATPVAASPHKLQGDFSDQPCGVSLGMIDTPTQDIGGAGLMAMAFGYILGFEAAQMRDLSGDHETVLMRFRAACLRDPAATGLDILRGF